MGKIWKSLLLLWMVGVERTAKTKHGLSTTPFVNELVGALSVVHFTTRKRLTNWFTRTEPYNNNTIFVLDLQHSTLLQRAGNGGSVSISRIPGSCVRSTLPGAWFHSFNQLLGEAIDLESPPHLSTRSGHNPTAGRFLLLLRSIIFPVWSSRKRLENVRFTPT